MSAIYRLRAIHATLGVLAIASYLTAEEMDDVHAWLGYGVALAILMRFALAFAGAPQLGLFRFYPDFTGLKLGNLSTHPAISRTLLFGIALSLVTCAVTGIIMDRGRTIGLAGEAAPALLSDDDHRGEGEEDRDRRTGGHEEGWAEEVHETSGNALILLVVMHVTYLLAFKRPLALFMLFARDPAKPR